MKKAVLIIALLLAAISSYAVQNIVKVHDLETPDNAAFTKTRGFNVNEKVDDISISGVIPGSGETLNSTIYDITASGKAILLFWGETW